MRFFGKSKLNRSLQKTFIPAVDVHPICPHCERELNGMYTQQVSMPYGKTWLYFCTNCRKVLGTSQRKGFWMG